MKTSKFRLLTCLLAVLLCCTAFSVTAFAKGAPESETPPVATPEPTIEPGDPLSEGSDFNTRDLLYDKATNKQFITVTGRDGAVFYIVIDYDAPVNEDEEQYITYFLNQVDEADLQALLKEGESAVCNCVNRCAAGAVDTTCPICAVKMAGCVGKEAPPAEAEKPAEPTPEPEVKKSGVNPGLILFLVLALLGGGTFCYIKFIKNKPKTKAPAALDDYDFEEDEEPEETVLDEGDADEPDSGEEREDTDE